MTRIKHNKMTSKEKAYETIRALNNSRKPEQADKQTKARTLGSKQ